MNNPSKTIQPVTSLIQPETLQMGAGPTPMPKEVAEASAHMINHLGEPMNQILSNIQEMGRYIFQTKNKYILAASGPASAAMEMSLANTVTEGTNILCLVTGTFSNRFVEMAENLRAKVTVIRSSKGKQILYNEAIEALENGNFEVVTMVHGESCLGVYNTEIEKILNVAKRKGVLTIVDAVVTVSCMPFYQDKWGVDIAFTGGQKGLSSVPGASLISISENALKRSKNLRSKKRHWCYDIERAVNFWINHKYHFTAPVTNLMALHEALRLVCEETLEKRQARHKKHSEALQQGLRDLGLEFFNSPVDRLNTVVAFKAPKNIPSAKIKENLKEKHQIEISGSFDVDILRIGQMGEQCKPENIIKVLTALLKVLKELGYYANSDELRSNLKSNLGCKDGLLDQIAC